MKSPRSGLGDFGKFVRSEGGNPKEASVMETIDLRGLHLTAVQVGQLINRDSITVARYARSHGLKSVPGPGGHRRFLIADVEEFIASGRMPGPNHDGHSIGRTTVSADS